MKIKKISSKLIKPHTPTPQNLKNYKISYIDGYQLPKNSCFMLFYSSKPEAYNLQLEESLAKILVDFYPLAGRFIDDEDVVDCSDQGAELLEAEAPDAALIDVVAKVDIDELNVLIPDNHFLIDEAPQNPLLSIQITNFSCGGIALVVSASHRIFDASSFGTFLAAWSSASNSESRGVKITPSFHLPSLLPTKTRDEMVAEFGEPPGPVPGEPERRFALKRLLFDEAALTRLKSGIKPANNARGVSRVRVACAVIAKALMRVDRAVHGEGGGCIVFQLVDLRERTVPPQPRHACGNFICPAATPRIDNDNDNDIGVQELVDLLGETVRKAIAGHVDIVSPDRDGRDILANSLKSFIEKGSTPHTNLITISDCSRFGLHQVDFGWGKPVWGIFGPQQPLGSIVKLFTTKEGDGIEAIALLSQDEMRHFDQVEDIKIFIC